MFLNSERMNSARVLEELKCSVFGLPEHFVKEPKLLSCGHPVSNVHMSTKSNVLVANSLDLDTAPRSLTETMIKSNLEQLSKTLYSQIKNAENEIDYFESF